MNQVLNIWKFLSEVSAVSWNLLFTYMTVDWPHIHVTCGVTYNLCLNEITCKLFFKKKKVKNNVVWFLQPLSSTTPLLLHLYQQSHHHHPQNHNNSNHKIHHESEVEMSSTKIIGHGTISSGLINHQTVHVVKNYHGGPNQKSSWPPTQTQTHLPLPPPHPTPFFHHPSSSSPSPTKSSQPPRIPQQP